MGKLMALVTFLAVFALSANLAMAQDTWIIDPAHSAAQFRVRHLMISNVQGEFGKLSGKILFDGKNYATVKAEAAIEVASINTREPKRDEHLRSADFFDAAAYPKIVFVSKRVENINGNRFDLVGDLTIRGVTKLITLKVESSPIIKGMSGESRIGVHAETKLDRQDYGVKWNRAMDAGGVVVGNEVQITLDLELIRSKQ